MSLEFKIRSSSWSDLFDCAYRWEAVHILGMYLPAALRTHIGTAVHAGTAAFDQGRLDGQPITADDACGIFVDTLIRPQQDVDLDGDETFPLDAAEKIGLRLVARYCFDISPQFTFRHVEKALRPLVIECDDATIILTGTLDRAAEEAQGIVIPDIKTGARILTADGQVNLKGKKAQVGAYQLMYENDTGEPTTGGRIIGLHTHKDAGVAVSRVFDGKTAMIGTPDTKGLVEMAATMLKQGLFPPNPQSSLCSQRFCPRWASCAFHE